VVVVGVVVVVVGAVEAGGAGIGVASWAATGDQAAAAIVNANSESNGFVMYSALQKSCARLFPRTAPQNTQGAPNYSFFYLRTSNRPDAAELIQTVTVRIARFRIAGEVVEGMLPKSCLSDAGVTPGVLDATVTAKVASLQASSERRLRK
jgi:hypothetical protein